MRMTRAVIIIGSQQRQSVCTVGMCPHPELLLLYFLPTLPRALSSSTLHGLPGKHNNYYHIIILNVQPDHDRYKSITHGHIVTSPQLTTVRTWNLEYMQALAIPCVPKLVRVTNKNNQLAP